MKTGVGFNLIVEGYVRRRDFIKVITGSTVVWPLAARAQQSAMPVIGFINSASAKGYAQQLAAFLQGLGETGYVDGRNVVIEYRWAEGNIDRMPALAAVLVRRKVAVIAATSTPAAMAAKAATTTIPIVFETGGDPIELGLVRSLSRPDSNVTGTTQLNITVAPKRLELLRELLPTVRVFALLVNSANPALAEPTTKELQAAAHALGVELQVLTASADRDFDETFAKLIQLRVGGLVIGPDPFFISHSEKLAALAIRHAVPTVFETREFAVAGGLLTYSSSIHDAYRLAGVYTGRILKGEKPADLPVWQPTTFEFVINLRAAKTLGLVVPPDILSIADEVIE